MWDLGYEKIFEVYVVGRIESSCCLDMNIYYIVWLGVKFGELRMCFKWKNYELGRNCKCLKVLR